MKSREDFIAWAQATLRPALQALEARRLTILSRVVLSWSILLLLGSLAAVFHRMDPSALVFILIFVLIVGSALTALFTSGYKQEFKNGIISNIVKYISVSLIYDPAGCVSENDFSLSRLFRSSLDRYAGEDLVRGRIGSTDICFSEVHAEYKTASTDSKGQTHAEWHTIFKGLFFTVDFNKAFQGTTLVVPDTAERLLGAVGRALQSWDITRPGELIHLEDPEFEKEFAVFGTDPIEARYILSASLMRRITEFKRRWGRRVHLSFAAARLHVAIEIPQNLFEPRLFRSLADPAALADDFEHLALAADLVEELNLNTRIWSKA